MIGFEPSSLPGCGLTPGSPSAGPHLGASVSALVALYAEAHGLGRRVAGAVLGDHPQLVAPGTPQAHLGALPDRGRLAAAAAHGRRPLREAGAVGAGDLDLEGLAGSVHTPCRA